MPLSPAAPGAPGQRTRPLSKVLTKEVEVTMSFLRLLRTLWQRRFSLSSFARLPEQELEKFLQVACYGSFRLTDAVRPSYDLKVTPAEGYRHDAYEDPARETAVPVLLAAVSAERLFEIFLDLIDPIGDPVDVVLETSHDDHAHGHVDLYRQHIDMPVLKSVLGEYENLLTNDGCTGVAVLNRGVPCEVQLDEHKLLIAYGDDLAPFEAILSRHGIPCKERMRFIHEAEHMHSSLSTDQGTFAELAARLGFDGH